MAFLRIRFRSALRDRESDDARISSIRAVIQAAIRSAETELSGLSRRLEAAMADAATAYQSVDDSYAGRATADEARISSAESRLVAAQQRSTDLRHHIGRLQELEDVVKAKFQREDGPTP
jgi:chromosome segregation ATPase